MNGNAFGTGMPTSGRVERLTQLTPELLIRAYAAGVFPMAETRDDPSVFWIDPDQRGILPFDAFHVPRSLRKTLRRQPFTVTVDADFNGVVAECAEPTPERGETWINEPIAVAYADLHEHGLAHSVECWRDGRLVGGLYGVSLGGAFFGESMFSRETDASKIALVHLVARLRTDGFSLLDIQFITDHLQKFGAREIPRDHYHELLDQALAIKAWFQPEPLDPGSLEAFVQSITQTS